MVKQLLKCFGLGLVVIFVVLLIFGSLCLVKDTFLMFLSAQGFVSICYFFFLCIFISVAIVLCTFIGSFILIAVVVLRETDDVLKDDVDIGRKRK